MKQIEKLSMFTVLFMLISNAVLAHELEHKQIIGTQEISYLRSWHGYCDKSLVVSDWIVSQSLLFQGYSLEQSISGELFDKERSALHVHAAREYAIQCWKKKLMTERNRNK